MASLRVCLALSGICVCGGALAACGGGASSTSNVMLPSGSQAPITTQTESVREISVPRKPNYPIAVGPDGAVYFSYLATLDRYFNGSFTTTQPAVPPDWAVANVDSVEILGTTVAWTVPLQGSEQLFFDTFECGGDGTATICSPPYQAPPQGTTSAILDRNGFEWAAGGGCCVTNQKNGYAYLPAPYYGSPEVALGPDGNVWAANVNPGSPYANFPVAFFEFDSSSKIVKTLPLPSGVSADWFALGTDGRFWFTDAANNKIGAITTSGAVTEYSVPTANALPNGITLGADGAMWFTETQADKIGRIDTSGHVTEYQVPTANAQPAGIAATPAGCAGPRAVWFTELNAAQIGEVTF